MIFVIGSASDPHSVAVNNAIHQEGGEGIILDYSEFPLNIQIAFTQNNESGDVIIGTQHGEMHLDDVSAVFYRRPQEPHIPAYQRIDLIKHVKSECEAFLEALHLISPPTCRWVSNPIAVRRASLKPYQLCVAHSIGFRIPRSVIGNSGKSVETFLLDFSEENSIAAKAVHRTYVESDDIDSPRGVYTQRLSPQDVRSRIEKVKNCPLIFQEYIEKKFELRITVVKEKVFACAIYSQESPRTKIDWRRYDFKNTPHVPFEPPDDISRKCVNLLKELSLEFGCIDMIVTPDEQFVFLEINPVGQWLWIERLTGLPITKAIASILMQRAPS